MSLCKHCRGDGLVFIRYTDEPGYDLAACRCEKGQWWRTKHQLRAKAATLVPKPQRCGRLEEFYADVDLQTLTTVYEAFEPRTA